MGTSRRIPAETITAATDSTSPCIYIASGWMQTGDVNDGRAVFELVCVLGNAEVRPVLQFANTPDGTFTTKEIIDTTTNEGYKSAEDVYYPDDWHTVINEAKANQLFRVGFQVRLSSPGDPGFVQIRSTFEVRSC